MARQRHRACLEQGLNLRLYNLMRQGLLQPPINTESKVIRWFNTISGETVARGVLSAEFNGVETGILIVRIGSMEQRVRLVSYQRHFGGRQWYFRCPVTYDRVSVLWLPPGARSFASRQRWGRHVAYASQFETASSRAITGARKIRLALGGPDWASIDAEFPPKPARMRWRTYERLSARCSGYEDAANERLSWQIARWFQAI